MTARTAFPAGSGTSRHGRFGHASARDYGRGRTEFSPGNYTPALVAGQSELLDQILSHLKGIDDALGGMGGTQGWIAQGDSGSDQAIVVGAPGETLRFATGALLEAVTSAVGLPPQSRLTVQHASLAAAVFLANPGPSAAAPVATTIPSLDEETVPFKDDPFIYHDASAGKLVRLPIGRILNPFGGATAAITITGPATYNHDATDEFWLTADASGGAITINLDAIANAIDGQTVVVHVSGATTAKTVTVTLDGSDEFDGDTSSIVIEGAATLTFKADAGKSPKQWRVSPVALFDVPGIAGVASGTAFPASPADGWAFYRSDHKELYHYDAGRSAWTGTPRLFTTAGAGNITAGSYLRIAATVTSDSKGERMPWSGKITRFTYQAPSGSSGNFAVRANSTSIYTVPHTATGGSVGSVDVDFTTGWSMSVRNDTGASNIANPVVTLELRRVAT